MINNKSQITDIWYYIDNKKQENIEKEIFYFKLKKYKNPIGIRINFKEHEFYKLHAMYKLNMQEHLIMNKIVSYKKLELYEIEFGEKYKSLFNFIIYSDKNRILFYNKSARKLFSILLEELKKIV